MFRGASQCRVHHRLTCLSAFFFLLWSAPDAGAQCVPDTVGPAAVPGNHSVSSRSVLHSAVDFSNAASLQLVCRKVAPALSDDVRRLAMSVGTHLSTTAGDAIAHDTQVDMDPRIAMPSSIEAQMSSPIAARFDVRWQNSLGPAWAQNIPDWVTSNARNYRHRGLPLVHLWESPHYLVALGLSNRGVPGLYFSQRLP
jgi:hypothetical protein